MSRHNACWWLALALAFISIDLGSTVHFPLPKSIYEINPTLYIYASGESPVCSKVKGFAPPEDIATAISDHLSNPPRAVFVTHGYKDSISSGWMQIMKNAMLEVQNQTVVLVDWGEGAGNNRPDYDYKQSFVNMRSVATWLAGVMTELRSLKPKMFMWGIGHGLGAHIMGVAGRIHKDMNRITGLDPSGPYLTRAGVDTTLILSRNDAPIVDVIHSDGCTSSSNPRCWVAPNNHYATMEPLGRLDFYPNYGEYMPTQDPLDIHTSHRRAVDLFIISIEHRNLFRTNEYLYGRPGNNGANLPTRTFARYAEMGYFADRNFIPTDPRDPSNFYINQNTLMSADQLANTKVNPRTRRSIKISEIDCFEATSNAPTFFKNINCWFILWISIFLIALF